MNARDSFTHIMQVYQNPEEPERLYAVAGVYWRIMLFIEILIFGAAIAAGAYMLVITFFNFALAKPQNGASKNLNRAQLSQMVESFEARKNIFEQLKTNATPISDPSK